MDCSTPGFPFHHQLPELAETHVHLVGDAIHPSHLLSSLPFLPSIFPSLTPIHDYWTNHSFDYTDLCWQNNVSAFYTLSRLVIIFLQRSKRLLISWLQSPSAVILESKISSHLKQKSLSIYVDLIVYLSERLYNLLHIGSLLLLLLGRFTRVRLCATP